MASESIRDLVHGLIADDVHLYVDGAELKYRARKGSIRDADRKRVSAHKVEIIEYLRVLQRFEAEQSVALPPIEKFAREPGAPLPLSFAQQRLWFIDQLGSGRTQNNMPGSYALTGRLDVGAFERALATLLDRHEVLRTQFRERDGEPHLEIMEQYTLPWVHHDLSTLAPAEQLRELRRLTAAEAQTPFDLARDLMLRMRVLTLSSQRHQVLFTLHHIASDGWSVGVFRSEFDTLYGAYSRGRANPLPPLAIQYSDFARWQRRWLPPLLDQQVAYWREQLKDLPPLLTLPTDRQRPRERTFRGRIEALALPATLAGSLQTLSREHGATLYMTLLAAFGVLLGRYAGQQLVAIGTPMANRTRRETEGLIGFFVNTLVMRQDLRGDPTFVELLRRTRESAVQAYAHQDVPFEQLVEKLNPERSLSHSPLFQVMFMLQNLPLDADSERGEAPAAAAADDGADAAPEVTARFDLTLSLHASDRGLIGGLEYNTDLFDRDTARRLLHHYERLLEAVVTAPTARLSQLEMLGPSDRDQQLVTWNATRRPCPLQESVHELFEAQARLRPDAVALVCRGEAISYGELNRRANRLAHRLIARGARPETRVGLHLRRSPDMVIALLATLKAGAAYVPLDPSHPRPRLLHVAQDSGMTLLIGDPLQGLADDAAREIAWVPPGEGSADGEIIDTDPGIRLPSMALAYVLYTSGSTGKPKGTRVSHGNVVNFLRSMQEVLGVDCRDRLLAVTTLSFDIALLELYLPLTVGGTVDIAPAEMLMDGDALMARIERTGVSLLQATPVTWKLLLDAGWQGNSGRLTALVGGEAFSRDLASSLQGKAPRIFNLYGPTETTIWSTSWLIESAVDTPTVPIGRPIANTRVYVLDDLQRLVPTGAIGQLYIAGAGVAQGYLGRPGLTAEKFLPDHFGGEPGARLYCTGDLVRWRPDGTLEYLGRADHQVKVRGHRIELGEIEAALLAHPALRDAVVVVLGDHDDRRLAAYIVPNTERQPEHAALIHELRLRLQAQLPGYMVPSDIVVLDALPLTSNGKIDRRSLPAPERSCGSMVLTPPQGPVEEKLAALWCQLLKRERVGRDDNFFELGGHSLLAVRLIRLIRQEFATDLPLQAIFESPSVAALAARLGKPPPEAMAVDADWISGSL